MNLALFARAYNASKEQGAIDAQRRAEREKAEASRQAVEAILGGIGGAGGQAAPLSSPAAPVGGGAPVAGGALGNLGNVVGALTGATAPQQSPIQEQDKSAVAIKNEIDTEINEAKLKLGAAVATGAITPAQARGIEVSLEAKKGLETAKRIGGNVEGIAEAALVQLAKDGDENPDKVAGLFRIAEEKNPKLKGFLPVYHGDKEKFVAETRALAASLDVDSDAAKFDLNEVDKAKTHENTIDELDNEQEGDIALQQLKNDGTANTAKSNVEVAELNNKQPLTTAGKTAKQKSLLSLESQARSLKKIQAKSFKPAFNKWRRGINKVSNTLETFGLPQTDGQEQFTQEMESLFVPVEQFFNQYRREITGAAAAVKELEDLKKAVIHGNLSYTQFESRLGVLMENAETEVAAAKAALSDGVDVSQSSKNFVIDGINVEVID